MIKSLTGLIIVLQDVSVLPIGLSSVEWSMDCTCNEVNPRLAFTTEGDCLLWKVADMEGS